VARWLAEFFKARLYDTATSRPELQGVVLAASGACKRRTSSPDTYSSLSKPTLSR